MATQLRIAIDGRPALWPRTRVGAIAHHVLKNIPVVDPASRYTAYFDADPGKHSREYPSVATAFGGPRQQLLWSNTWLPRRLAKDGIDVFLTVLDKEVPLLRTRSRIVCMVHDLIPLRFPETVFRNSVPRLYYQSLIRAAVRRADMILTNSQFSRGEILSLLPVDETKVHVIPLGAEMPSPVSPAHEAEVLRRCGLSHPFVLAMGSTEPRRNNRRVIEAMRLLAPVHPHLRLAIAGHPRRGVRFESSLLDERICLLGHVADADLSVLMSAAEMLVFPSLQEGFGLPVLEAMAHGTPVITSEIGAIPEVADDAVLYANPRSPAEIAAQMHCLLVDPGLRMQLSRAGQARASRFRWKNTCTAIAQVCHSLMGTPHYRSEALAS
jgi:glycosyltransferase involved in cell wall biosynthesis